MIRHHYSLTHVCREISLIIGNVVTACFTQEADILMLGFQDNCEEIYLECNANPTYASAAFRENFAKARKNVHNRFQELIGQRLANVLLDGIDRILHLHFSNDFRMELRIFGSAKSDILLFQNNAFLSSFSGRHEQFNSFLPRKFQDFPPETIVSHALAKSDFLLGEYYAREACRRSQISPEIEIGSLSSTDISVVTDNAAWLREECEDSPIFYILQQNEKSHVLFSLIPLVEYPLIVWRGAAISEGIRKTIGIRRTERRYAELHKRLETILNKKKHKLTRSYQMASSDAISDTLAQQRRRWAELLLSHPSAKERHGNSIDIIDWNGLSTAIQLDPRLTLAENASVYYEKAKNATRRSAIRHNRLPDIKKCIAEMNEELTNLAQATTIKQLEIMAEKHLGNKDGSSVTQQAKYRTFALEEGFTAYAGKNAANNDELTMRFAKPNDYWFHARGASGSHVVLRGGDGKTKPSKRIIEQAASIAAYYSQQRNGGYVPVAYTKKKYVRKPKGANIGAVLLEREEVIMARPKLPFGEEEKTEFDN